jgi:hypothetical protein
MKSQSLEKAVVSSILKITNEHITKFYPGKGSHRYVQFCNFYFIYSFPTKSGSSIFRLKPARTKQGCSGWSNYLNSEMISVYKCPEH